MKVEDLFPTLTNLVNIPLPENLELDGSDITTIIEGKETAKNAIFTAHYNPTGDNSFFNTLDKERNSVPLTKKYVSTFDFTKQKIAIRKGDYKYIQNESGNDSQLYNITKNASEKENLIVKNDSITNSLKEELKIWYTNLFQSKSAFKMPVFQIGYKKSKFNQIYACAPAEISKNLINKEHFLTNWQKEKDEAIYNINVITPGEYEVFLVFKIENYKILSFKIAVGGKSVTSTLKDSGDRDFGTLLENESAYWEKFDLKDTFKKDIRKAYLGKLNLDKGLSDLKLTLSKVDKNHIGNIQDQLIAIQLIKK